MLTLIRVLWTPLFVLVCVTHGCVSCVAKCCLEPCAVCDMGPLFVVPVSPPCLGTLQTRAVALCSHTHSVLAVWWVARGVFSILSAHLVFLSGQQLVSGLVCGTWRDVFPSAPLICVPIFLIYAYAILFDYSCFIKYVKCMVKCSSPPFPIILSFGKLL